MQKTIRLLTILLAAQLLLALGLDLGGTSLATEPSEAPLLALAGKTVDRITLEGEGGKKLLLAKTGDGWVLPAQGGFPADPGKVQQLLDRLSQLKHGLPVATSAAALKRFKVDEDAFERRIRLAAGDKPLATLYLGTTPGARRVHARSAGEDAVYAVDFAVYDAPLKAESWENTAILQIPKDEIEAIQLAGIRLQRQGPQDKAAWSATDLSEGEAVATEVVDSLAEKLAGLRIGAVLGREEQADYQLDKPVLQCTVLRKGDKQLSYRLGKRKDDYVLKVSTRPEYFRLPGYAGDALLAASKRDKLITRATVKEQAAAAPVEPTPE